MRNLGLALLLAIPAAANANAELGEHLAYIVGCINCHHQTPKVIFNAPPLLVVQGYTLAEFRTLMKTGVTRAGRDMAAQSSVMGIVAREQFARLSDLEVRSIHDYLTTRWTADQARVEEAKIPALYKAAIERGELKP